MERGRTLSPLTVPPDLHVTRLAGECVGVVRVRLASVTRTARIIVLTGAFGWAFLADAVIAGLVIAALALFGVATATVILLPALAGVILAGLRLALLRADALGFIVDYRCCGGYYAGAIFLAIFILSTATPRTRSERIVGTFAMLTFTRRTDSGAYRCICLSRADAVIVVRQVSIDDTRVIRTDDVLAFVTDAQMG